MGRKLSPEDEAAVERQVRAVRAAIDASNEREAREREEAEQKAGPRHTLQSITHGPDGSTTYNFS